VSAVWQQLLAREWAAEEEHGLRITKPDALLDEWVEEDRWNKRTETREYSLLEQDPDKLADQLVECSSGKGMRSRSGMEPSNGDPTRSRW
jgi:hypothetical protein